MFGQRSAAAKVLSEATLHRVAYQDRADAYNTFVLVGTLVFGFGITFLFEYDDTLFKGEPTMLTFFIISLSLVVVFSGVGSVTMAIEYYALKKMLSIKAMKRLEIFERKTHQYKNMGRICIYFGFACLYISMSIYVYAKVYDDSQLGSIICIILFGVAFITVAVSTQSIKNIQRDLRKNPTLYEDGQINNEVTHIELYDDTNKAGVDQLIVNADLNKVIKKKNDDVP